VTLVEAVCYRWYKKLKQVQRGLYRRCKNSIRAGDRWWGWMNLQGKRKLLVFVNSEVLGHVHLCSRRCHLIARASVCNCIILHSVSEKTRALVIFSNNSNKSCPVSTVNDTYTVSTLKSLVACSFAILLKRRTSWVFPWLVHSHWRDGVSQLRRNSAV